MKAVYFNEHGPLDVLRYGDLPDPSPGPEEVLVRLEAASLNRLDIWVRDGWPGIRLALPHVPGSDGAGTIAAVGERAAGPRGETWDVGDRVVINASLGCGHCEFCLAGQDNVCRNWGMLGETRDGTFAQYVAVPAKNVHRIPDGFGMHEAAAAALAYQTAWHSLITRGRLQAGESVLVVGATGGVNTASIQVAKYAGAQVYVIGSNAEKLAVAESLGADYLVDRSREANWSKSIFLMTGKRGVDMVVDNVGTTYAQSMRAVRKGGRILTVGNTGSPQFEFDNRYMFGKHLSLLGSTMSTRLEFLTVMDLVFAGKLLPVLDRSYPLSDARAAVARMEKNEQMGKITLEIA